MRRSVSLCCALVATALWAAGCKRGETSSVKETEVTPTVPAASGEPASEGEALDIDDLEDVSLESLPHASGESADIASLPLCMGETCLAPSEFVARYTDASVASEETTGLALFGGGSSLNGALRGVDVPDKVMAKLVSYACPSGTLRKVCNEAFLEVMGAVHAAALGARVRIMEGVLDQWVYFYNYPDKAKPYMGALEHFAKADHFANAFRQMTGTIKDLVVECQKRKKGRDQARCGNSYFAKLVDSINRPPRVRDVAYYHTIFARTRDIPEIYKHAPAVVIPIAYGQPWAGF